MQDLQATGPAAHPEGVFISTYGCQMNENDSERMYSLLEMANYVPVTTPEQASLIIINSCSVREKPVHKVHSEVGKYRKLKEINPGLRIGVGGCVGSQERDRLLKSLPLLDFVFGPDNIDSLPSIVDKIKKIPLRSSFARFEHTKPYEIETLVRNPGVSTFVNITKGCDNFCTFCVVPFTRGRLRSRPLTEVVQDVKILARRGVKEVTLLGQNVNSYASSCGASFSKLLETLAVETSIERIRFTTSHPKDFDRGLVEIMARHREKVCEYIHLPVQSGSSPILERMNRGYSAEEYFAKIEMIRELLPEVALSTDIIVGFPGETEEDFQATLRLVERVDYDTLFAFKYSPRPFTKAAKYEETVTDEVASRRLDELLEAHKVWSFAKAKKLEGTFQKVLVENEVTDSPGVWRGRAPNNKTVMFEATGEWVGRTATVRVTRAMPLSLRGELVTNEA